MRILNLIGFIFLFIISIPTAYCENFTIVPINKNHKQQMTSLKTWTEGCPVILDRLRVVKFSYYDFDGKEHQNGEIVVLDAVSERVLSIFKELHNIKFPIAKAYPIEHYDGNDEKSMLDNNSSSYNCREITGGGLPSIHSYGLAIDINPIQNPYISFNEPNEEHAKILPSSGKDYINRTNMRPGMAEYIIDIFKKNGFTIWGGKWNTPIDWQHFQIPRTLAQLLAVMSFNDGKEFFNMVINTQSKIFETIKIEDNKFVQLYQKSPEKFIKVFRANKNIFEMEPSKAIRIVELQISL